MEDQGNQRVQAHAAAALINFTEDCPKSLLIPYLDNLVKHLHSIMVLKLQEVSVQIIRASSCEMRLPRWVRPETGLPARPRGRELALRKDSRVFSMKYFWFGRGIGKYKSLINV